MFGIIQTQGNFDKKLDKVKQENSDLEQKLADLKK